MWGQISYRWALRLCRAVFKNSGKSCDMMKPVFQKLPSSQGNFKYTARRAYFFCSPSHFIAKKNFVYPAVFFMQGWRSRAAQKSSSARRARDSLNHLLITCDSQLSGHVVSSNSELSANIENSLLHMTLDIDSMRMALLYCCELIEATPAQSIAGKPSSHRAQAFLTCRLQITDTSHRGTDIGAQMSF